MARYDPRWIAAKFGSKCKCGESIRRGDMIYYYPLHKRAVCRKCGERGERDLTAEISYDRTGTDCAYDY